MKYCSGYPKFTSDEKGFISYFGVERPYLYNNHTLTIFPSNEEDAENAYGETERVIFWETDVSPLPESFFGSTYDGRKAVFLITDDGMIENGVVIFYSVTAFFYHLPCLELEDEQNIIQGLTISLPELNSFFPPEKAYELSWKVNDTGTDYTVKTNSREE